MFSRRLSAWNLALAKKPRLTLKRCRDNPGTEHHHRDKRLSVIESHRFMTSLERGIGRVEWKKTTVLERIDETILCIGFVI